ncbi:MAG TPA: MerR family transcriptional regulator [Steroidobacter sp.]|jgi:MerR family redox-sensitive transcriptional activator SoxR|nr:MerR family transcriptional regulator [Steroidobacter sp.]
MKAKRLSGALPISDAARQFGLRSSALRYYEQIGLLRPIPRTNGQRCYDEAALQRLAVICAARQVDLSLEEIAGLFARLRGGTPVDQGWRELSTRKIAELEQLKQQISKAQDSLRRLQNCRCSSIEMCGEKLRARVGNKS